MKAQCTGTITLRRTITRAITSTSTNTSARTSQRANKRESELDRQRQREPESQHDKFCFGALVRYGTLQHQSWGRWRWESELANRSLLQEKSSWYGCVDTWSLPTDTHIYLWSAIRGYGEVEGVCDGGTNDRTICLKIDLQTSCSRRQAVRRGAEAERNNAEVQGK